MRPVETATGRLLCRFSDAGSDDAGHRLEDRRLKSAEARNRGKWGTVGAACSMGISRGVRLGEVWSERARLNCFASQDGCG